MLFLVPRLLHSRVYFLYNTSTAGNKHWSEKAPGTRGEYFLQGSKFDPSEVLKRKGSDFLHLTPCTTVYKPQPQQTTNYRSAILYFVFIVTLCQCTLHFIRTSGKRSHLHVHQRACNNNHYLANIVTCTRESPQKHHTFCSDLLTAVLRVVSLRYNLGSGCLCN